MRFLILALALLLCLGGANATTKFNATSVMDFSHGIPMAGGKISGMADGESAQDAATVSQLYGINTFGLNACINPQFQVNQRALASYTDSTSPATHDDTYLIDQVNLLSDGNNIVSVAQELSVVPMSAPSAMKFTQVTANKKSGYIKFIENKDAVKLAGKHVSFQIKAATATSHVINNIRVAILTRTGTADTLTSDPVSVWGAQGTNPTFIAEWTCRNTPVNLALTTSYQVFKTEDVAIPAGITNLAYMIWIDDTDAVAGDIVYFGDEELNEGAVCYTFMSRTFQEDLAKCERFLEMSYAYGTAPGTASTSVGLSPLIGVSTSSCFYIGRGFKVAKPITTTVTLYSYAGTINHVSDTGTNNIGTNSVSANTERDSIRTISDTSGTFAYQGLYRCHWVASAEL